MANPNPAEVKADTAPTSPKRREDAPFGMAPKADDKPAQKAPEPARASAPAEPEAKAASARYRVVKAFTLEDGRTIMPGEEWSFPASWPARREKQLVDQGFLEPIA